MSGPLIRHQVCVGVREESNGLVSKKTLQRRHPDVI